MYFVNNKKKIESMMKENAEAFKDKKLWLNLYWWRQNPKNFLVRWTKNNKHLALKNAINQCFQCKESGGEVLSHRLANQQHWKEEVLIFSQTPLLNIPQLILPAEFKYIHSPVVTCKNSQPAKSGKIEIFSEELDKTNKRSINTGNSAGAHHPFHSSTKTGKAITKNMENQFLSSPFLVGKKLEQPASYQSQRASQINSLY